MVRVAVNGEVKFFVKIKKKLGGGGGRLSGLGGGGWVRVDVNKEMKFLCKLKKIGGGGESGQM